MMQIAYFDLIIPWTKFYPNKKKTKFKISSKRGSVYGSKKKGTPRLCGSNLNFRLSFSWIFQ